MYIIFGCPYAPLAHKLRLMHLAMPTYHVSDASQLEPVQDCNTVWPCVSSYQQPADAHVDRTAGSYFYQYSAAPWTCHPESLRLLSHCDDVPDDVMSMVCGSLRSCGRQWCSPERVLPGPFTYIYSTHGWESEIARLPQL